MRVVGIDPGLSGAIAVISDSGDHIVDCIDMPTLELKRGRKNKRELDHVELALAMLRLCDGASAVFVERVQSMPGQGVSSSFAFGRATGIVIGLTAAQQVPLHEIAPVRWRRLVGLKSGSGKDAARALCKRNWPVNAPLWSRVKDEGRADAALIALAGLKSLEAAP
ncbi:MAG: crossover junction endodeoxyribonuclease RuvC [Kiloniellales bacterium]